MDAAKMKEILKKEYGITNEEEFKQAVENSAGIDIGLFTMPFERRRKSEQNEAVA